MNYSRLSLLLFLAIFSCAAVTAQDKPAPACSEKAFAAQKAQPKLTYECSENLIESDSRILRLPRRRAALARVRETLRSFTSPTWWETSADELNACELHGSAGELTDDEKASWRSGDFYFTLFGDHETRLVLISDPCYQTGFNGSNAFLLQRHDGQVVVTQVLDGYYSRVDNSVSVNFARLHGQRIVEVSTGNSMPPSFVSYFFAIDRTGRAVPKKIFRSGGRLTNEIYSAMLLAEPRDFNLPAGATELNVIRARKLARTFSAYEENENGRLEANGRRFRRIIYRWNGRFYSQSN